MTQVLSFDKKIFYTLTWINQHRENPLRGICRLKNGEKVVRRNVFFIMRTI